MSGELTGAAADAEVRDGVVAGPLHRDVVRVSGRDAAAYLQGQLSQDLDPLAVGAATWSFVLQPTGKVDAWVRVTRLADDAFLLDLDGGHGEALVARLLRFRLRTAVDVEQLPGWTAVAVRGPGSDDLEPVPPAGGVVVPAGWPGVAGLDVLGPGASAPVGVARVDAAAVERLRIRSGVPRMGAELTEATIPAEAGPAVIQASVSFTKGCYTGQELVARIDSRGGNVPRRVLMVAIEDGWPPVGAEVEVDGRTVGSLTSVEPVDGGAVALASIARAVEPPATGRVVVAGDAHPARLGALPLA